MSGLAKLLAGRSGGHQKEGKRGLECHAEQLDFSLGIDGEPKGDFEQEWGMALRLGRGWTGNLVCSSCGRG